MKKPYVLTEYSKYAITSDILIFIKVIKIIALSIFLGLISTAKRNPAFTNGNNYLPQPF